MPSTSACVSRSSTGSVPPAEVVDGAVDRGAARVPRRDLEQALGRVGPPVEDHVLDPLQQVRVDVVVLRQGTRVDDRHVEAGADRVVQEHGVDRLADAVVAAERERHVGHAAADPRVRERRLEPARRLEERDRVAGVLLDARGDREDVGVEDDVVGREPGLLGEQRVARASGRRPGARPSRPGPASSNAITTDGGAVPAAQPRLAQELVLALLERDRVDDAAALELLQPGLDHRPLGAVDHDRARPRCPAPSRAGAGSGSSRRRRRASPRPCSRRGSRRRSRPGRARSRRPRPRPWSRRRWSRPRRRCRASGGRTGASR